MSRIGQALKRRDKDGRPGDRGDSGDSLGWRRWHEVETPIVPAWQLERFPIELPGTHEAPSVTPLAAALPRAVPDDPATKPARFRQFSKALAGKVVGDRTMNRAAIEQYRRLAASLHHVQVERGTTKIMITSAVSGEGKTLTALNLAVTLSASYRRRVVLIDANLRSPSVHALLDTGNVVGLSEVLSDARHAKPALVELSPRLFIVPAGRPDPDPMGPLTSPRMATILDEMAEQFDWVIVDTPPVVHLPDTNLLVGMVDAAIVVIEAGRTSYEMIERAIQVIGRQRVLGFVLNGVEDGSEITQELSRARFA
jgi:capsular exopolysaccharide synthesis family protein